jgi:hypothetical protein
MHCSIFLEWCTFLRFSAHVAPHFPCRLILDNDLTLFDLISNKEVLRLDVFGVLAA